MVRQGAARGSVSGRTWVRRALVAITIGLVMGAAGGVFGVNTLEPGRAGQPDSLQLMLDERTDRRAADDARIAQRVADSVAAAVREQRANDSIALANDPDAPLVPDVVSLPEAEARAIIEEAGLTVGAVIFRNDSLAAGTVLGTSPPAGIKVRQGTAVEVTLSDGRPPQDIATRSHDVNVHSLPVRQHSP